MAKKDNAALPAPNPGDIWDFELDTGTITCLILGKEADTLTVVKLFNEWRSDSDIEVNAQGTMKYACTAKISYTFEEKAVRLLGVLKTSEWVRVQNALAKRFGIETQPQEPPKAPEPQVIEKIVEVPVRPSRTNKEMNEKIQQLRDTINDLEEADGKLSQARTARFIGRYMDVLEL